MGQFNTKFSSENSGAPVSERARETERETETDRQTDRDRYRDRESINFILKNDSGFIL